MVQLLLLFMVNKVKQFQMCPPHKCGLWVKLMEKQGSCQLVGRMRCLKKKKYVCILPFGLVQAPNRFTTFRWFPMWISIFNSDIKALCSLAVAPSETHTHTLLFISVFFILPGYKYQVTFCISGFLLIQISPFSILTATVSKLLFLLML